MAKCQFCGEDQKAWDGQRVGYVTGLVTSNGDGTNHVHVHGSFDNKIVVEDIIKATSEAAGLDIAAKTLDKLAGIKEIVFHNRQRIGDMFMFTCAIRDFKKAFPHIKVNVNSTCGHIWDNNPYIDRDVPVAEFKAKYNELEAKLSDEEKKKQNVYVVGPGRLFVKIGPSGLTNASNRLDWHFANAFRMSIEENLGVHIPQGESRGEVWITEDEYNAPRVTEKPYWVIVTGGEKGWGCKMYPTVRWQEVIDQNPDILFYQLGAIGDRHDRLKGSNVVDYIGKTEDRLTGIRDLIKLFLNAEGSMGLVSFHMHLSGALKKAAVVVAGAREPVSFTRYAGHQYIANDGCLPCATTACWHCDLKACTNPVTVDGELMPKCVDMIKSSDVTAYLRRYYEGGRLSLTTPSEKPKGLNIVKTPITPRIVETPKTTYNTYGLEFNGGALTERDWEFISGTIDKYGVKSVLEFGAGLSTLLLNDKLKDVVTYEDKKGWIDKIKKLKNCEVRLWDGKELTLDRKFDMAFVDGPAGDLSREASTRIGTEAAPIVIVHDAGREHAKRYQAQFLEGRYEGPIKGGHRCHLWVKKEMEVIAPPIAKKIVKVPVAKKYIKFVSTAKGWGGCARSITTMMRMLLDEGHNVEFIPFRNSVESKEFQEVLKADLKDIKVTLDFESVSEPCDTFFMYADDYIWEFKNGDIEDAFSNINASKKIMTLNYRRGAVGEAEWTKGWDKYLFLNKAQETELKRHLPDVSTRVLAPCTDLTRFFMNKPDFNIDMIRIVRHSSQGDTKFSKNFGDELANIHDCRQDLSVSMMPGPSFIQSTMRFNKIPRVSDADSIARFLETGNLFWYSLPEAYMDMGPRVIIEAMAAGLPILADNWGGAQDRVTQDCGWLCNKKSEMVEIVSSVTTDDLERKGQFARERARNEFDASQWVKEITE